MKVHYINILLFAHALNILAHNNNKPSISPHQTPTTRSLCECELYAPVNYDNDPQMKRVMQQFEDRTTQRLREYDDRMKEKRKQCKEQCDKEIQKIILKDKLEKELMDKFATLDTDIQSDAIPTCVCEKSIADKTEKFCLNCGKTMGGVAPGWGLVNGLVYAGWTHYAAITLVEIAKDAGIKAGLNVGLEKVTEIVTELSRLQASEVPTIKMLKMLTTGISADDVTLPGILETLNSAMVGKYDSGSYSQFSMMVEKLAKQYRFYASKYSTQAEEVSTAFNNAQTSILTQAGNVTNNLTAGITASVIAIVVIVLIMVIIYLILRYRRKKKMKKKLQYTKLLKE
ncbi:rifin PIR protein, putative [Plasmodium reichenowi]|uniref:Rifin PIR protein, putative n=1 Tax=Plasmodium reichenowi TaxID=5854 RepID=A0A2P9D8N5_PLARE|nr:rifin PIR protein, putative [Plasmodium reichenowi]